MRSAETVLGIIHDRGKRGLPLEDVIHAGRPVRRITSAVVADTGEPGAPKGCAVKNGGSNPCRRQEKLGEMLLGQPSYLMAKVYGDKSMTVKRGFGRTCQTQCPARPARYG